MALMFPEQLRSDSQSSAEKFLHQAFQKQLIKDILILKTPATFNTA